MIEINGKVYKTYDFHEIDRDKYHGFIYVTINKLNGKKYVGQHISWNEFYLGSGAYLWRAIRKYGPENFERIIIDLAETQEELDEKETFYIASEFNAAKSKDWYNIKDGSQSGGNTLAGLKEEDYQRWVESHSERMKGEKNPSKRLEVRKKISKAHEERKYTVGKNNPMYGKGHLLAGEKNGMYGKGYKLKGEKNGRAKPIVVYKDGKFYAEYDCVIPLVKLVGRTAAYKLVNGWIPSKRSPAYGWSATYKEDSQKNY